MENVCITR